MATTLRQCSQPYHNAHSEVPERVQLINVEFKRFLSNLKVSVVAHHGVEAELINGDDFNVMVEPSHGPAGKCLYVLSNSLGLNLVNSGREPNFLRKDVENFNDHYHLCSSYRQRHASLTTLVTIWMVIWQIVVIRVGKQLGWTPICSRPPWWRLSGWGQLCGGRPSLQTQHRVLGREFCVKHDRGL